MDSSSSQNAEWVAEMFASSFNPSSRPSPRTDRGAPGSVNPSKSYVLPVPQGFSVRVFKGPTLSSRSYPAQVDLDYRPMSRGDSLSRQPSSHGARQDTSRKLIKAPPEDYAFPSTDRRSYENKPPGMGNRYANHPGAAHDTFIYERPLSTKSYYPSDMMNDDAESVFSLCTQASGSSGSSSTLSTETPQSTGLYHFRTESPASDSDRSYSPPPGYAQRAYPYPPLRTYSPPSDITPPSRPQSAEANRGEYIPYASRPLPTPPVSTRLRKDSIMLASERASPPNVPTHTRPRLTLARPEERSFEHVPSQHVASYPSVPMQRSTDDRGYTAPRGIHSSSMQDGPDTYVSPPPISRSTSLKRNGSYNSVPLPPGLESVPGAYPTMQMGADEFYGETPAAHRGPPIAPQRRNSDGNQPHLMPPRPVRSNTEPPPRSVRWDENLICPSPILPCDRRKGFFNRRGDQLWTNEGAYRPAPHGQEYPPDLDDYPEPGEGWQNEEGVRIDLRHRRIPRIPVRPALKQTNYNYLEHINIAGLITSSPVSADEESADHAD
ncbi:hypothetical protein BJ138DRAFT_737627 [Hygrophoropsis aurantiaca]|uniref:Uncharacterized protein n=1 Tax=Hygrophoropsis aurantiaca TaxID=72124 RepID=A0ACB8AGT9_9AGAM|nr:hypothetical protein BJ138DRAFT_737627 [Hygrophoropsis aurantiaca]